MKFHSIATLALAAMLCAGSAQAQGANAQDLRCAIVGLRMMDTASEDEDPETQTRIGNMLAWYHLGRIEGRAPRYSVRDAIPNEFDAIDNLSEADYAALEVSCFGVVTKIADLFGDEEEE